ncbi:DUF4169 family protein [Flavisphingomonas formosensis]|uniref:DUF4169 family protein n=1 Tax=Flavisphingomonas formosensis TaxID=861534 RepID=UPI0012F83D7F|nr:DUF4169 family protein [Sphingomonas formosensis]
MAEIINLRSVRKARVRAEAESKAAANRQLHGQSKADKRAVSEERKRREALLDGAKRETDEPS